MLSPSPAVVDFMYSLLQSFAVREKPWFMEFRVVMCWIRVGSEQAERKRTCWSWVAACVAAANKGVELNEVCVMLDRGLSSIGCQPYVCRGLGSNRHQDFYIYLTFI